MVLDSIWSECLLFHAQESGKIAHCVTVRKFWEKNCGLSNLEFFGRVTLYLVWKIWALILTGFCLRDFSRKKNDSMLSIVKVVNNFHAFLFCWKVNESWKNDLLVKKVEKGKIHLRSAIKRQRGWWKKRWHLKFAEPHFGLSSVYFTCNLLS